MLSIDVVEDLNYGMTELLLNPTALGHSVFNGLNESVALLRVVVAGVNDGDSIEASKEVSRQLGDIFQRNCDNHDFAASCGVGDGGGFRAGFLGEGGERVAAARV